MTGNYIQNSAFGKSESDVYDTANRVLLDIALLAYDTVLTLSHEVPYIWLKKTSIGAILYIAARYPSLVGFAITIFLAFSNVSLKVVSFHGSFILAHMNCIFEFSRFRCILLQIQAWYAAERVLLWVSLGLPYSLFL
jgi:Family of unknown function (DUF6533)